MEWKSSRRSIVLVVLMLSSLFATGIPVASADAVDDEQRFVDLINAERRAAGSGPLVVVPELVEPARAQAQRMIDADRIFHTSDLGSIIDGWKALGENVGRGGNIDSLHQKFMDSPDHRENLLNPAWDGVGVGVIWSGNVPYVVEIFIDPVEDLRVQFTPPFSDDDGSIHERDIVALYELGITRGCDTTRYCPDRSVTRGEMATMLVRAFGLGGSTGDVFVDDDSSIHESAIQTLAANGVTNGCAPERFCPDRGVTRAEMASFLTRILELPPAPSGTFTDTSSSVHASAIDALAQAGITRGCSDDAFCPQSQVTRAQLASFLIRALDR